MAGRVVMPPMSEEAKGGAIPTGAVACLLDTLDKCLIVSERGGRILLANARAKKWMEIEGNPGVTGLNLFSDVLKAEAKQVLARIERGEDKIELPLKRGEAKASARIQWMPEPDWIVLQFDNTDAAKEAPDAATQLTVQELLQEREITYRNLLAAYLKLQEVNRQKTEFLASAA